MTKMQDYFKVIPSTETKPVFLAGNKRRIKAGLALGIQAVQNDWPYRVLIFGYPGSGKTEYSSALAYALNTNGHKYSLLRIKCMGLTSFLLEPSKVKKKLAEIERNILPQFKPLIIELDEFDSISLVRTRGTALDVLCDWTMNFLAHRGDVLGRAIVLCITNYPGRVDPAVLDRIEMNLYFELPDKEMAIELIVHEGIPAEKAPRVVEELFAIAATQATVFSGRSLLSGVQYARHVVDGLNDLPPGEIAATIKTFTSPTKSVDFENYKLDNEARINLSNAFVDLWSARAETLNVTFP